MQNYLMSYNKLLALKIKTKYCKIIYVAIPFSSCD